MRMKSQRKLFRERIQKGLLGLILAMAMVVSIMPLTGLSVSADTKTDYTLTAVAPTHGSYSLSLNYSSKETVNGNDVYSNVSNYALPVYPTADPGYEVASVEWTTADGDKLTTYKYNSGAYYTCNRNTDDLTLSVTFQLSSSAYAPIWTGSEIAGDLNQTVAEVLSSVNANVTKPETGYTVRNYETNEAVSGQSEELTEDEKSAVFSFLNGWQNEEGDIFKVPYLRKNDDDYIMFDPHEEDGAEYSFTVSDENLKSALDKTGETKVYATYCPSLAGNYSYGLSSSDTTYSAVTEIGYGTYYIWWKYTEGTEATAWTLLKSATEAVSFSIEPDYCDYGYWIENGFRSYPCSTDGEFNFEEESPEYYNAGCKIDLSKYLGVYGENEGDTFDYQLIETCNSSKISAVSAAYRAAIDAGKTSDEVPDDESFNAAVQKLGTPVEKSLTLNGEKTFGTIFGITSGNWYLYYYTGSDDAYHYLLVHLKDHTTVLKNKKTATYFTSGYTGDKVCSVCGTVVSKGKTVSVLKLKTNTISSLKSSKKKTAGLVWTKNKDASGYTIQYSTDSKFKKGVKTVTIKKNSTVKATLSKLTSKKKYYVRIRSYKTGKVSGKTKTVYSSWSKTKSVTVK